MRKYFIAVAFAMWLPMGVAASDDIQAWLTSTEFIFCDETRAFSCAAFPHVIRFEPDGSVKDESGQLRRWKPNPNGGIFLEGRGYQYRPGGTPFFVSPLQDDGEIGFVVVANTEAGSALLTSRESSLSDPESRRQVVKYHLRTQLDVHNACVALLRTEIGDESFVPLLVRVLPSRPENEPQDIECTYMHCAAALAKITRRTCGPYREDWEKCLAESTEP